MKELFDQFDCVLTEAAVVERLRRNDAVELDEMLAHAPLVYSDEGKKALKSIYLEYINIAASSHLPILIASPTWRTNKERVQASGINSNVNIDAVQYLKQIVQHSPVNIPVKVGGLMGCKNDCYLPEEALSIDEAKEFHAWQIGQLAAGGADFLMAVTLPSVAEATGIALAMEEAGLPYILSFVVGSDGKILDGTTIEDALETIDSITQINPLGYFINCSYPSFVNASKLPRKVFDRLIGIQANASSLSHAELDGSTELKSESLSEWGDLMVQLNKEYGLKALGGCCGTSGEHLQYLANKLS
ncbi:MAG: homocysteine S-methyltransferase family protein [Gammaproteobacteria bacterium]|nr:homocysteine S-methyltransferase family protein [Gammaproteobacteria bacterium]